MNQLASLWVVLLLAIAGCSEPDPPPEPELPPELSPEIAKQALVAMLRDNPNVLDSAPQYPPERLAGESEEVLPTGKGYIGAFSVDLSNLSWNLQSNGSIHLWLIDGKFEFVGQQWIAKPARVARLTPGPGKSED